MTIGSVVFEFPPIETVPITCHTPSMHSALIDDVKGLAPHVINGVVVVVVGGRAVVVDMEEVEDSGAEVEGADVAIVEVTGVVVVGALVVVTGATVVVDGGVVGGRVGHVSYLQL